MSYSLNSLRGAIWGIIEESITGVIKGDIRSLEYRSCAEHEASELRPLLVGFRVGFRV